MKLLLLCMVFTALRYCSGTSPLRFDGSPAYRGTPETDDQLKSIKTAFTQRKIKKEKGLSVESIVKKYGYPFQIFTDVVTEDGYLLDVYRIPHGKLNNSSRGLPVLLVHGLGGSSRNFVAMGPERGLVFLLADRGYDVWLANCRGTVPSTKHLTLNPKKPKYWMFSWHEIGVYDLPATFELMRDVTKSERFAYIGHSQGVTAFFVMASEKPQYSRNITVAIALAPPVYVKMDNPLIGFVAGLLEPITRTLVTSGLAQIPPAPFDKPSRVITNFVCSLKGFQELCETPIFLAGLINRDQVAKGDFTKGIIIGYSDMALKAVVHYIQILRSGEFRQYNYGPKENMRRYGSNEPPLYNLANAKIPVALYWSEGDIVTSRKNVDRLCEELPQCIQKYLVPHKNFAHYHYVLAQDIIRLVYGDVFNILEQYNRF